MPKTKKNLFGWLTKKKTTYRIRHIPVRAPVRSRTRGSGRKRAVLPGNTPEQKDRDKQYQSAVKQAEANLADAQRQIGKLLRSGTAQQKKEARDVISAYRAELGAVKAHRNPRRNPGLTGKFQRCVEAVKAKGGAYDPKAVCAARERRKYGQKALTRASIAGKKRAAKKRANPKVKIGSRTVKVSRKGAKVIRRLTAHDKLKPAKRNSSGAQIGVRIFDGNGRVVATLWQHLDRAETEANLDSDGMGALSDWSGTWKPREPKFPLPGDYTYEIVTRKPAKRNAKQGGNSSKIMLASALAGPAGPLAAHFLTNPKGKKSRRNPDEAAERMYELFHGKRAENIVEYETPEHKHFVLWCVGDLACLKIITIYGEKKELGVTPIPKGDKYPDPSQLSISERIVVAANEDGTQLFFVGGDQSLDLKSLGMTKADIRDNMLIGVLRGIVYQTRKGFDEFELTNYTHKLGEETGMQPVLIYHPRSETMEVSGGQYRLKRPGIIN